MLVAQRQQLQKALKIWKWEKQRCQFKALTDPLHFTPTSGCERSLHLLPATFNGGSHCIWVHRAKSGSLEEECDDEVETALERAAAVLIFESSATSSTSANAALAAAAGASSRRHGIIRCSSVHVCRSGLCFSMGTYCKNNSAVTGVHIQKITCTGCRTTC